MISLAIITFSMDPLKKIELLGIFEDIEEDIIAFATPGHAAIPCCQDSLTSALICVYRKLCMFYEGDELYENLFTTKDK